MTTPAVVAPADSTAGRLKTGDLRALAVRAADLIPAITERIFDACIDNSGSMRHGNNVSIVRTAVNDFIARIAGEPWAASACITLVTLRGKPLCDRVAPAKVPPLTKENYWADGNTPLYDRAYLMAKNASKALEKSSPGTVVFVLFVSDGEDNASTEHNAADVKRVVLRLKETGRCIVAALGLWNGHTDYESVFTAMGIDPVWIYAAPRGEEGTRSGFQTVGDSVTSAGTDSRQWTESFSTGFVPRV